MYTVYMHICPNEKRYIGITSQRCEERWKRGKGYTNNRYFTNAIEKYGWDNIEHVIIKTDISKEEACALEKQYIKLYDTTNREKGFNISTGGESSSEGFRHSEEAKRKISAANKGKKLSKDSIEKTMAHKRKKVEVYSLSLELIKVCDSLTEAERLTGVDNSNISATCKGKYSQFKGYVFRYADTDTELIVPKKHRRPINMYTIDGVFIKRWETIKEAARFYGIPDTHISDCCKGKYTQSGGFKWEYA